MKIPHYLDLKYQQSWSGIDELTKVFEKVSERTKTLRFCSKYDPGQQGVTAFKIGAASLKQHYLCYFITQSLSCLRYNPTIKV